MSRTVTLLQLRTRSLRRADMATTGFVTASEVNDLINDEWPEVHRLLVQEGPPDWFSSTASITTTAGTIAYALPADCYQPTCLYALNTNGPPRPILPSSDFAIAGMVAPQAVYSLTLEYVPAPTVLANDGDTIDGIAGFDALVTARVARRLFAKAKKDTSQIEGEIGQLTQSLMRGGRHTQGPRYVTDVESDSWLPCSVPIGGFRARGGNIEIYETRLVWP